jgi:hypothetical protein
MNSTIKTILNIFAILLMLAGGTWILQGINILPGSFMTGDPQWAINGAITVLVGAGLFWFVNRKK